MEFAYRFRLNPTPDQQERLAWTLDTCRQVRNHFLHRMNRNDDVSSYSEQNRLPDLKQWWTDLQDVNSKVLQKVVDRLYSDRSNLAKKAKKGYKVGKLKWKGKGYYHSFEYNQSGHQKSKISGWQPEPTVLATASNSRKRVAATNCISTKSATCRS